jgi:hypothetical protein
VQRLPGRAPFRQPGLGRAEHVHEEAELVVDVESGVDEFSAAHFVAISDLMLIQLL